MSKKDDVNVKNMAIFIKESNEMINGYEIPVDIFTYNGNKYLTSDKNLRYLASCVDGSLKIQCVNMSPVESSSIIVAMDSLLDERSKHPERFMDLPCDIIEKPVVRERTHGSRHRNHGRER